MTAVGIVCEYNPFHSGHALHLAETRRHAGRKPIVCCMSGNFVQRGDYAVFPKHLRAEAAVRCGADLVVELPAPWAVASAPRFAAGAVHLLSALGCDAISFGSESGDGDALACAAETLSSPAFSEALKAPLARGRSFAEARAAAAEELCPGLSDLLSAPNDNLAVEYLRAADLLGVSLTPLPVRRVGAAHDALTPVGGLPSASSLRALLREDPGRVPDGIPTEAADVFAAALADGRGPVFARVMDGAHMAALRRLSEEDLARLPDMGEGFEHRLFRAIRAAASPAEAADLAKTRRYPHARIRRQLLCAYLGITAADAEGLPPYAQVLAFNDRGRALLAGLRNASMPRVIRPSRARLIGPAAALFRRALLWDDLYMLALPGEAHRRGASSLRASPAYVRDPIAPHQ